MNKKNLPLILLLAVLIVDILLSFFIPQKKSSLIIFLGCGAIAYLLMRKKELKRFILRRMAK